MPFQEAIMGWLLLWIFRPYYKSHYILPFAHLFYIATVVFLLLPGLIISHVKKFEFGFFPIAGAYHWVLMAFLFGCVFFALYSALSSLSRTQSKLEQKHILVLIGLLLTFSLGSVDFLQNYEIFKFFPIGFIASAIFVIGTAWAMHKYALFMDQKSANSRLAYAVANTAQMIAHDIQKPFFLLQTLLEHLQHKKVDAHQLESYIHHLNLSQTYVEQVLRDLLIFGSERVNQLEAVNIQDLFQESWGQLNYIHKRKIQLETNFDHTGMLLVDNTKVQRLFANILINAIENAKGTLPRIWIKSKTFNEKNKFFIEITIGNSGSFIDPQDIQDIFLKHRRHGSYSGSGLGLTIAQQVVESHGGTIRCESDRTIGTEFVFTLPRKDTV